MSSGIMEDMADNLVINDTHAVINMLTGEYHIPQRTAEGIIQAIRSVRFPFLRDLATKGDVSRVEKDVKQLQTNVSQLQKDVGQLQDDNKKILTSIGELQTAQKWMLRFMCGGFTIIFIALGKLLGIY